MASLQDSATSPAAASGQGAWKEEGGGVDPAAVSGALIALMLGYLDAALPQLPADQLYASGHAENAMQVCLAAYDMLSTC